MIMPTGETELQLWVADTEISQLFGILLGLLANKPTRPGPHFWGSKVGQTYIQ